MAKRYRRKVNPMQPRGSGKPQSGQRAGAGGVAAPEAPAAAADESRPAGVGQPETVRSTLEQQRAKDAWEKCAKYKYGKDHVKLAKGLPALIVNSGLMQTMAFLHEKGSKERQRHCHDLADHLRAWLHKRFGNDVPGDFEGFMSKLMEADTRTFQDVTTEAFAWLRWMRQMAAARVGDD